VPTGDLADPVEMNTSLSEVRRRGQRRLRKRRTLAGIVVVAVTAMIIPISLLSTEGGHVRVHVGTAEPKNRATSSVVVPDTFPGTKTAVPAALRRPLHLPEMRPGQACPTTTGKEFRNTAFDGIALGAGPVRVIISNRGDLERGQADLGATDDPRWLALQTLWFASPAYNGPFVVRGQRIDAPGVMDTGGGQSPIAAPLTVASGPTENTFDGYRTVPNGAWVTHPGCYAIQVDGLTFSEVIVVDMRSAVIVGTLETNGGAAPGKLRELPGDVTVRSSHQAPETVSVGSDGTFSVPVAAGTYTITGRSRLYQGGHGDCVSAGPITVTTGATRHVAVVCEEK
jgi:hypothetical protein